LLEQTFLGVVVDGHASRSWWRTQHEIAKSCDPSSHELSLS
jgi:hypothetical protein